jgi:hypothetical protein
METFEEIILVAKSAYKKSFLHDCEELQDDLLSIITMVNQLKHESTTKKKRSSTRKTIGDSKYKDIAIIAYVLSEFGHQEFSSELTQAQVIENLANTLKIKSSTLRNIRDSLDSYTNSTREGWKIPLSDKLQNVFDECVKIYPPKDVVKKAKNILLKYEMEN